MNSDDDKTQTHVILTKGTMVSHYRIVEKIGAGGMGEVYLAEDTKLKRKVALKFLPPHLCQDDDCRERFKREAQAAAKLDHPNIVPIHEVGEFNGRPFFAMALIEGQSLREVIKEGKLTVSDAVNLTMQICEGLHKAHESGIVHRDIKPANIIIDKENRPRLLDFGLAAIKDTDLLTKTGSTLGTVGYMSPEQVQGRDTDQRSDLFSLGIVLYEMIAGRLPFKGDTEAVTMNSVINESPEPLSRYKSGVSSKLQDIVSKLLEKDQSLRYQSAVGVISDLKRLAKDPVSYSGNEVTPPSIAVLPFTNLSADPEQEYFCDGMAEEIINALTRVEGLRVVARTSCFAFKGKNEDIRKIGQKLNVDNVLEGSVRKAGNRVRITGQLIKISDGYHLWSDKYDRDLEDIFEVQDEISLAIVRELKVKLLGDSHGELVKRPTDNLEAYSLYLRGRFFWNKRLEPELIKAIEYFEQALQCDPEFALGWAGNADAHVVLADHDHLTRKMHLMLAEKSALKALELDNTIAEAHTALAQVRFNQWKWSEAEAGYLKAIELNQRYATAHHWYGLFLAVSGHTDQSREHLKLARELDPLSLAIIMGQAFVFIISGQSDKAIDVCHEGIELTPDFPAYQMLIGWALIEKGDYSAAIEHFNLGLKLSEKEMPGEKDPLVIRPYIGMTLALMGEVEKAREILKDLIEEAKNGHIPFFDIAAIWIALGDTEQGFEWLERSFEDRDDWLPIFCATPFFDSVRDDPRFVSLMSRIGIQDKFPEVSDE
ncbi:MAG: protein kinase [candidate division Zixibacteria bacterium]|nr:protein kinase [candidate division Zixibacteria bacterium]